LLASPESATSETVGKELIEARGKPIHRILVGGTHAQLPEVWLAAQVTDFQRDYRASLHHLLTELEAPKSNVASLFDLFGGPPITVEGAAAELLGVTEFRVAGRRFLGLPVESSGYTMTRLVGSAEAELRRPEKLAVLLVFTGSQGPASAQEVLDFWVPQNESSWLVWVEGPANPKNGKYELSGAHVWETAVRAAERAVEQFGKGRSVDLFLYCPVALSFAIGARLRQMSSYRLHNYQRGVDGKPPYEMVLHLNTV